MHVDTDGKMHVGTDAKMHVGMELWTENCMYEKMDGRN